MDGNVSRLRSSPYLSWRRVYRRLARTACFPPLELWPEYPSLSFRIAASIPEPSTLLLGELAVAGLLWRRRSAYYVLQFLLSL